jgi:hypothetical protein
VSRLSKRPVKNLAAIGSVILLFAVSLLIIALTFYVVFGGSKESNAIAKNKYQAVFLNNGQVYFGHIKSINRAVVDLKDIYYLQTSNSESGASSTPSNVSLVKLGCELHAPNDQMLINKEQVIFWENITDESQVVKAIKEYQAKGNKDCSTQSQQSTEQAPSSSTNTTTPTTSTGTTGTTRKP